MTEESANHAQRNEARRLRLNYHGVFDVRFADDVPVEISSIKARALLAYLALAPNMRHSREHLAALLWDRSDDERARASLRQAVGALRKAMGPESDAILNTKSPDYLALDPEKVDIVAPEARHQTNGGFRTTEFLADLNIRSEPFEEWRRDAAAGFYASKQNGAVHGALANGRQQPSDAPDALSSASVKISSAETSGAATKSARSGGVSPLRFVLLIGAIAVLGVSVMVGVDFDGITSEPKPYVHGEDTLEIMRQTATRQAHPDLNDAIDKCEFDRPDPDETIAACTRVINALGNDDLYKAIVLTIRGSAHRWNGNFSQSTEDISQALLIDPSYHNAHHHMAYSYFLYGEYDQALEHYARVKQLFPVHVMSHYRTGEVYLAMQDYKNAEAAFSEAISLAPDFAHAYLMRGKTRIALDREAAAKSDLRRAASLRPSLRTDAQEAYVAAFGE